MNLTTHEHSNLYCRKMNSTSRVQKPHAVIVPLPAQGHINPLIQFGKLLHSTGFHITFVNIDFIHKRLIETKGSDFTNGLSDFRFETVQAGLAQGDTESTRKSSLQAPFKELLIKLNSDNNVPPVSCVISDAVLTFPSNPARELGIPEAKFWTASACGVMGYYQNDQLVKRGLIPLKDENGYLETPLEWIPGMKGVRLKDMPSFSLTTDPNEPMVEITIDLMKTCERSSAMIINTIYELEEEVLKALASYFPPVYTIGPLTQLISNLLPDTQIYDSLKLNLWKEDAECLNWLDKRETKSVVYVNFGSIVIISEEELNEFAIALENCGFHFLWVLRPNIVKGLSESKLAETGFVERTKERGLILSWCPQEKVLNHKSVGLFVSHAGWNSMLETMVGGVPMICWAHGAEQTTNSRQVCLAWKNGTAIEKNVKGNELSELMKEMMVGENGKEKRENALKWKKIAEQATSEGGSSSLGFHKLIEEVLLH